MALISRFGACAGMVAALSMISTPALAAEMPHGMVKQSAQGSAVFADFDFDTTTFDSATDISEWRGRGWRRGWRRHRRVDAGDVIAGVLIIGGIAAIADAASKNRKRDRRYDRDYERRDDRRYDRRDYRRDRRDNGARGLEGAVDRCVNEIERDVRVDSVDGVDRTAQGWIVTGSLFNGSDFTCAIDNNGQIDAIEYGELSRNGIRGISAPGSDNADGQWDDDRYIAARRAAPGYQPSSYGAVGATDTDQRPAYPGGPLPGEALPE